MITRVVKQVVEKFTVTRANARTQTDRQAAADAVGQHERKEKKLMDVYTDEARTTAITAVAQVVLRERQGRDRGWWEQMKECFAPDSLVSLSWIHDTGAAFVARSKALFATGERPVHRLSPPVVDIDGNRAVVEVSAEIQLRKVFAGVEADLTSYTRLLYQLERSDADWKIKIFNCIYERDTLVPVVPGTTLHLDTDRLGQFREPYRYLGYTLSLSGQTVRENLYGDDKPDQVEALYAQAFAWMRQNR